MQFQVPQFIDTEDKIVGPLSLRQFAYVGVAAILSAIFYFFVQVWLWAIASIFFFGAAIALAFVKIEGRPFANVIISALNFYWKPQTYIWQPEKPPMQVSKEKIRAESERSALEEILAQSAAKIAKTRQASPMKVHPRPQVKPEPEVAPKVVQPKIEQKVEIRQQPIQSQPKIMESEPAAIEKPIQKPVREEQEQEQAEEPRIISREMVSAGVALHKIWEDIQTGASLVKKSSDRQFIDKKMAERYQILQRSTGDRAAAKRVDYR
jgi:hypothetical protein